MVIVYPRSRSLGIKKSRLHVLGMGVEGVCERELSAVMTIIYYQLLIVWLQDFIITARLWWLKCFIGKQNALFADPKYGRENIPVLILIIIILPVWLNKILSPVSVPFSKFAEGQEHAVSNLGAEIALTIHCNSWKARAKCDDHIR